MEERLQEPPSWDVEEKQKYKLVRKWSRGPPGQKETQEGNVAEPHAEALWPTGVMALVSEG